MVKDRYPVLKIKGGPQGAYITEVSLDGRNLMQNAYSVDLHADVNGVVEATVGYRALVAAVTVEADTVKHVLSLERVVWKTNPVDGEQTPTPHRERITEEASEHGLPAALRALADKIEKEEVFVDLSTGKPVH